MDSLLLILNSVKQLSQMNRGFLQLHLHLGDLRGNISAWELYFDSFNAAVIPSFAAPNAMPS